MRSALLCAYSAEKLFIIEQCRAVCGPPGIAFSRVGSWRKTAVAAPLSAKARRGGEWARPLSQCLSALTALPKGEPLAVHANFISLPRPLPLGEVSPKVTERARPLRKSAGGTERTLSVIAARCHLPRRGRFCSACRQTTKSSPFGGAGCDQREQTERVCPLDISPLLHYNASKMNHSKMKG